MAGKNEGSFADDYHFSTFYLNLKNNKDHKYRNMVVCPTCSIHRRTQNTNRSSTVIKTKTNHVVVLETLSATFHFLRSFSILVNNIKVFQVGGQGGFGLRGSYINDPREEKS